MTVQGKFMKWEQNLHDSDYMRAMSINKLGLERQNGLAHIERREQFQSSTMAGIYCLGLGFEVKVGSCPCNFPELEACWSCEIH